MDVKEIERSIIKTYRKTIWSKFIKAINDYQLIQENDKIMVCISGGKDSFILAKCMQELLRHGKMHFEVKYVIMDPGYKKEILERILKTSELLNIPVEVFQTDVFAVTEKIGGKSPCYLCARMRRGHLYNKAKELGCNKIALGHHFDDVIETILLSQFYAAEVQTMMPKLYSDNFEGLELIRPLYLVREEHIIAWKNMHNLDFIHCACPLSEQYLNNYEEKSKRKEIKKLIQHLRQLNPDIDYNIFKSMENINMNCIIGYRKDKEKHNFLEDYKQKARNKSN